MKNQKIFFGLKPLFVMTSSQKIPKIFEKFKHGQNSLLFQGVLTTAKLFLLGQGFNVTSRGEQLLVQSFATML